MQCQESKKILDAYVDNEVDLMQSVALEEHLTECADCSKSLESRRALNDAIQDSNLRYVAPPELRKSVRKSLRLPAETTTDRWQWFKAAFVGFAAATALCAVIAAVVVYQFRTPRDRQLASLVVGEHIRSLQDGTSHLVDIPSSNQHVVKPWFNGRIDYSPKVTDFNDRGFPLVGGRLDYLNNRNVAVLIYKRYQHVINVFVYPVAGGSDQNVSQELGYNVISWSRDGMQYCVVSDLNVAELQQFAGMLKE
ncbi:MAG TPA: anti-sigma factor [Candidatus Angelobacter sp.]